MDSFIVQGGKALKGEIEVRGSKNAALPILAATLLTSEPSVIDNLPLIEDVRRFLEIIESLGGKIEWLGQRKIRVNPKNLKLDKIDQSLVKKLRSSVLLIGPLIHRFKKFRLAQPGGCLIGVRSIDSHLDAISQLGVKVRKTPTHFYYNGSKIFPNEIILEEFSVTATENILMLTSLIPGKTRLKISALEPHVEDLVAFLKKMGANIKIISPHIYEITGRKKLSGASHKVIPDPIEAGTFMILATVLRGKILIKNIRTDHLDLVIKKLQGIGVRMEIKHYSKNTLANILVLPSYNLKGFKIQTQPYPGIPTDLQSPFGVLATQVNGTSIIFDTMFEGRLKYIDELIKMGANAIIADPHRALITGPTPLYAQNVNSLDIRSGISLLIAALVAKGKTEIKEAYQIDRGYEMIDERLKKLGAQIRRK